WQAQIIMNRLTFNKVMTAFEIKTKICQQIFVVGLVVITIIISQTFLCGYAIAQAIFKTLTGVGNIGFKIIAAGNGLYRTIYFTAHCTTGDNIDHTANRLVAIENTSATLHDFDAFNIFYRNST